MACTHVDVKVPAYLPVEHFDGDDESLDAESRSSTLKRDSTSEERRSPEDRTEPSVNKPVQNSDEQQQESEFSYQIDPELGVIV